VVPITGALSMAARVQGVEHMCNLAGQGQQGGTAFVDCDSIPEMSSIVFTIAGAKFRLSPEDYVLKVRAPDCAQPLRGVNSEPVTLWSLDLIVCAPVLLVCTCLRGSRFSDLLCSSARLLIISTI
jgi:Eukaryotic aspartyl protease